MQQENNMVVNSKSSAMDMDNLKSPLDIPMNNETVGELIDLLSTDPARIGANTMIGEWFLSEGEGIFGTESQSSQSASPAMSSPLTPQPMLAFASNGYDSPLYSASLDSSPQLDSSLDYFPELVPTTSSTLHVVASVSDVAHQQAVNIPWGADSTPCMSVDRSLMSSILKSTKTAMKTQPATAVSTSGNVDTATQPPSARTRCTEPETKAAATPGRGRKRPSNDEKDPEALAEELAIKRAKNTDAARRSRLRKVLKMESLEREVSELSTAKNDLEKRIAVLESENKNLLEKNAEKDARVRRLEQQLNEAHQRLIKI